MTDGGDEGLFERLASCDGLRLGRLGLRSSLP